LLEWRTGLPDGLGRADGPILCVDLNNLCARCCHSMRGLTSPDGRPSGAIFGMIRSLHAFLSNNPHAAVVCVRDAGVPAFRKKAILLNQTGKGYKESRKERDQDFADEYRAQAKSCEEVLHLIGITLVEAPGYEADDLIAGLAWWLSKKPRKRYVTVLSGDGDLLQLAGRRVKVYRPIPDIWVERADPFFLLKKAIVGDASDDIVGVPQVGEKRVKAIFEAYNSDPPVEHKKFVEFKDFDWWIRHHAPTSDNKHEKAVLEHLDRVARNVEVVDLRITRKPSLKAMKTLPGRLDKAGWLDACKEWGFNEFIKGHHAYWPVFEESSRANGKAAACTP